MLWFFKKNSIHLPMMADLVDDLQPIYFLTVLLPSTLQTYWTIITIIPRDSHWRPAFSSRQQIGRVKFKYPVIVSSRSLINKKALAYLTMFNFIWKDMNYWFMSSASSKEVQLINCFQCSLQKYRCVFGDLSHITNNEWNFSHLIMAW